jgi:hypothetical protein
MNGLMILAGAVVFNAIGGKTNVWAWIFMITGFALIVGGLVL